MVEWRPLVVSIFFALAVYVVLLLSNVSGGYLAALLGAVALGYIIEGTLKDGVIHGALLGLIIGIINLAILLIQVAGYLSLIGSAIIQSVVILLVIEVVVGLVGGIIGTLLNSESLIAAEPEKKE